MIYQPAGFKLAGFFISLYRNIKKDCLKTFCFSDSPTRLELIIFSVYFAVR